MTRTLTDLLALREGITPGQWTADNYGAAIDAHARCVLALPELFDALERMRDEDAKLRELVIQLLEFINREGPAAQEWRAINALLDEITAALANRSEG